ncbi:hypothetical protein [Jiella pelagia]|uniref:Uncharacterized protein n=1 Tax=Jiella pelagia TaxID=2986949 RepID=A0ABY7BUM4_9HYPH|nr:hypothetical protein [Jiella pelagia]WAP66992.1 hypothetical protein OH818_15225 [Jiella pelagia]
MTACCADRQEGESRLGEEAGFRPIGGERRRYRPPMPVMELLQLAAAVIVCASVICGVLG